MVSTHPPARHHDSAQRKPKVRKPNWKHRYASNLDEAIELCADHAGDKLRRPAKVMADLMGVELKLPLAG
jgi:hypothetical protein